jgi:hypothetical protein
MLRGTRVASERMSKQPDEVRNIPSLHTRADLSLSCAKQRWMTYDVCYSPMIPPFIVVTETRSQKTSCERKFKDG